MGLMGITRKEWTNEPSISTVVAFVVTVKVIGEPDKSTFDKAKFLIAVEDAVGLIKAYLEAYEAEYFIEELAHSTYPNSIIPKINKSRTGNTMANSMAAAPEILLINFVFFSIGPPIRELS